MTIRLTRHSSVGSAKTLVSLVVVLVLGLVTDTPALGATGKTGSAGKIGQRSARVPSCLEIKVLRTAGTSLRFPSCWTRRNYTEESSFATAIAFFSNQPMHQPCTTTQSATGTTVRCGFPVKTLRSGGVLVELYESGMPGWTIADETGRHLVVDHHAARETVITRPNRSLHATDEFLIFIDDGVPDNYYQFNVYFRNPGVSEDQRLFNAMLHTMRIQ
jgi:hypothetical protein